MGLFSNHDKQYESIMAQIKKIDAKNAEQAKTDALAAQTVPIDDHDDLRQQLNDLRAAKQQAEQQVQTLQAEREATAEQLKTLTDKRAATLEQLNSLKIEQAATQEKLTTLTDSSQQRISDLLDDKADSRQKISNLLDKKELDRQRISDLLDKQEANRQKVSELSAWGFLETRDLGHHYVYELRLEDGYYYVGETSNLHERLSSHFAGYNEQGLKSAYWTSKHHPVALIGLIEFEERTTPTATIREKETLETLRLMRLYGYEKVRGGCFTAEDADQLAYFFSPSGPAGDLSLYAGRDWVNEHRRKARGTNH